MIYDRKKKNTVVCWQEIGSFFVVAGNFHYDREKKNTLRPEKKNTRVCLMGARFWRLRPEKKDTVVCLAGCAVVLFFVVAGNFDYDRKKKKIQSSVGGKLAVFLV